MCSKGTFHWFGDPNEEEFICIDTPGLNDEFGRDDAHINNIIEELRAMEYVNSVVFVANGQDRRFSLAFQKMIKRFEEAFSSRFYDYSIMCLTRWYMDACSVEEREDDGRTEEAVAEELNTKISRSPNLCCRSKLNVAFVDCFYEKRDPQHGKERLKALQKMISNEVFRTAQLSKVKPKVLDVTNTRQSLCKDSAMASMTPILFDNELVIDDWCTEPQLPQGITISGKRGIISGTPTTVCPPKEYSLFARSVGGVSNPFTFTLDVCHSNEDITAIVTRAMLNISEQLDALMPANHDVPSEEATAKGIISDAKTKGAELLETVVQELKDVHGAITTFPKIVETLRASYENAFMAAENAFLVANQQAISRGREQDQAENRLNVSSVS